MWAGAPDPAAPSPPAVLTEAGEPCRFPFRYGGRMLHTCTLEGSAHRKWWVRGAHWQVDRVTGVLPGLWLGLRDPHPRITPGVQQLTTTTGTGPGATVWRPPRLCRAQVGVGGDSLSPGPGGVGWGEGQGCQGQSLSGWGPWEDIAGQGQRSAWSGRGAESLLLQAARVPGLCEGHVVASAIGRATAPSGGAAWPHGHRGQPGTGGSCCLAVRLSGF